MKQKLHRRRQRIFKRRSPFRSILKWGLPVVAIIALGFFGAKYFTEHPIIPDDEASSHLTSQPQSSAAPSESLPSDTATDSADKPFQTLKAFYLPDSALADEDALKSTLSQAAQAGLDSVVLDMKDADGRLHYRSATAQAIQVNSFTETAKELSSIRSLFTAIRETGLKPIVRLYAFRDNAAARALADCRIGYQGQPGWVWYDGDPQNGGKAWLNPYSDGAQLYIIDLARELRDAGAAAVLLDGVQFPSFTGSADFGSSSNTTLSHGEVLQAFVEHARKLLGDTCPVLLMCPEKSALGIDTRAYGANPLTFHATFAAPQLTLSAAPADNTSQAEMQARLTQLTARINVMAADEQPVLSPILQTDNASTETLKQGIAACQSAGIRSYILFHTQGQYDFASLRS